MLKLLKVGRAYNPVVHLTITVLDDCADGIRTIIANSGTLKNENHTAQYDTDCEWTVVLWTITGKTVDISIEGFGLGDGDSLQVCLIDRM